MAWYWELPVCWECTRCGTISYGTRRWLRKTPPCTCPHCGNQSFTGVGRPNRPLSWSLPARGLRARQYARGFGWYVLGTGILSGVLAGLLDRILRVTVLSPTTQQLGLLVVLITGLVLGLLIHRGDRRGWIGGTLVVLVVGVFGVWVLVTIPTWLGAAVVCWSVVGVILAWKSAYVLRENPRI